PPSTAPWPPPASSPRSSRTTRRPTARWWSPKACAPSWADARSSWSRAEMTPDASGPDDTPTDRTPAPPRRRAGHRAPLLSALRRRRSTQRPGEAETLPDMEATTRMTDLETARTRLDTHLRELAGQDLLLCLDIDGTLVDHDGT